MGDHCRCGHGRHHGSAPSYSATAASTRVSAPPCRRRWARCHWSPRAVRTSRRHPGERGTVHTRFAGPYESGPNDRAVRPRRDRPSRQVGGGGPSGRPRHDPDQPHARQRRRRPAQRAQCPSRRHRRTHGQGLRRDRECDGLTGAGQPHRPARRLPPSGGLLLPRARPSHQRGRSQAGHHGARRHDPGAGRPTVEFGPAVRRLFRYVDGGAAHRRPGRDLPGATSDVVTHGRQISADDHRLRHEECRRHSRYRSVRSGCRRSRPAANAQRRAGLRRRRAGLARVSRGSGRRHRYGGTCRSTRATTTRRRSPWEQPSVRSRSRAERPP